MKPSRIVMPVRLAAWMSGDLGRSIERTLTHELVSVQASVTRLARGLVVEAYRPPGALLEVVQQAALRMEAAIQAAYPVMHHEIGPVWNGTLHAIFEHNTATHTHTVTPPEPVPA